MQNQLILGLMHQGGKWDQNPVTTEHIKDCQALLEQALALHIHTIDEADIYTFGKSQQCVGKVFQQQPQLREHFILQTKASIKLVGMEDTSVKHYDASVSWLNESLEQSLRDLHTDTIDVFLLHRPDPLMDLEPLVKWLETTHKAGKFKQFGVSNFHPGQISVLQNALSLPIMVNQVEISLAAHDKLTQDIFAASHDGFVSYHQQHNISVQAWGALAQGRLLNPHNGPQAKRVATVSQQLAEKYQVSPAAIQLAWLMRHPLGIKPIVGTSSPARLVELAKARDVLLSRTDWYALLTATLGQEIP